jgi:PAS domain S-box-containing protein
MLPSGDQTVASTLQFSVSEKKNDARSNLASMRLALDSVPKSQRTLIQEAFHELTETIEVLSVAEEELRAQNEQLGFVQRQAAAERARYYDLFEFAPDGYVVTDESGMIVEANRAADIMLVGQSRRLARRLLVSYVQHEYRRSFRDELYALSNPGYLSHFETVIKPHDSVSFDASFTGNAMRDSEGRIIGIRWLIRDISERKRCEARIKGLEEELSLQNSL